MLQSLLLLLCGLVSIPAFAKSLNPERAEHSVLIMQAEALQFNRLPVNISVPGHAPVYRSRIRLACMAAHAWKDELLAFVPATSSCMPLRELLILQDGNRQSDKPPTPERVERARLHRELESKEFVVSSAAFPINNSGAATAFGFNISPGLVLAESCTCPENVPPVLSIVSGSPQQVDAGAAIASMEFSATDADSEVLRETFTYRKDGGAPVSGLPADLSANCTPGSGTLDCSISGTAPLAGGVYQITLGVSDGFSTVSRTASLTSIAPRPPGSITVSTISGDTSEDGASATFTIVLDNAPNDNVTVDLGSSDPGEGTPAPASIVFTPANWDAAQQVTVTGVDDAIQDGTIAYSIITGPSVSNDSFYSGIDADDVSVNNLDNEVVTNRDRPFGGLAIPLACDGGQLVRDFNIADDGAIGTVKVGFTAGHARRGDIRMTLESPQGTTRELIAYSGSDSNANFDILLGTQAGGLLNNGSDDNTAEPFYDRAVSQTLLADFAGEAAAGTWIMSICDAAPGVDDGIYLGAFLDIQLDPPPNEVFCNLSIVANEVDNVDAVREACEILSIGPYSAQNGADITLSSGWEIMFAPGFSIQNGSSMKAQVCGQSLCMTSDTPMPQGCHSCVDKICAVNSSCCTDAFSQQCLDLVASECDLMCE